MRRPALSRADRRGMALLIVLLLVAVMAVIAVAVLDDVRFGLRRGANVQGVSQGQWYALGAESLARRQIRRLAQDDAERTPLQPAWNGAPLAFPLEDDGAMTAVLSDGQACFNLNSVVEGSARLLVPRPQGAAQFIALARAMGVGESEARRLADTLTDWIDSNGAPQPLGAEDAAYAGLAEPRRTAGTLMVEPSELRAVAGVTAALYARLAPLLCALPEASLSPINPNTLTEGQWPLLVMLTDGALTNDQARAVIRARPAGGWDSVGAFWTQPLLERLDVPPEVYDQVTLRTRYFVLRTQVRWGGAEVVRTSLLHDTGVAVRVASRRWTGDDAGVSAPLR